MKTLRPLYDKIIVQPIITSSKIEGIILPDDVNSKPTTAIVISVGDGEIQPDNTIRPLAVKKGDVVIYGKYSGTEIQVNGEEFLLLKEKEVFAIIEKSDDE